MKNPKLLIVYTSLFIISCSGSDSETSSTGDSTNTVSDSLPAGAAFEEFKWYVEGIPAYPENVDSILAHYEALKAGFSMDEKDSAFFVTMEFMQGVEIGEDELEDWSEESQKKLEKKYSKFGFEIWYEEGYPFALPDMKFLEQKFKKDISAELDDYLDVYKKTNVQVSADAGIIIEWSELADMLLACEEYLVENQDSKYADRVLSDYMHSLSLLMWGLDNTPVIDRWTDETQPQLDENVAEVYQKLIKDTKHKTGKIIADHLTWLESKNFTFEYEEVKYLSSDEVKMYLGIN